MKKTRWFRVKMTVAAACAALLLAAVAAMAMQGESADRKAFNESLEEWRPMLQKMYDLRQEYHHYTTGEARQEAIVEEFAALVKNADALQKTLVDSAARAFVKDPKQNADMEQFIGSIMAYYFEVDLYEESAKMAAYLLNEKLEDRWVIRNAGFSCLYSNDFESAKMLGLRMMELGMLNDFGWKNSEFSNVDYWAQHWEREKQLRERERMAGDLPRVLLKTTKGEIEIELFENEAPNTVANFIFLVEKEFYTNLDFQRVIAGFMAQGGGTELLRNQVELNGTLKKRGTGGPGYTFQDELGENARKHFYGSVSMANYGPDTNGSQFFIMYRPKRELDEKHTVFGRVVRGMDTVCRLNKRDPAQMVEEPGIEMPDKILSATVLRKRNHKYSPVNITPDKYQLPPFPKMPGLEDKPGDITSENWSVEEEIRRGSP